MIEPRKLAPVACVLAFAALALVSGADRLSESTPSVQRIVPPPFRSSANVTAASLTISRKNYARSEFFAGRAVAASPMNRQAIGALALARFAAGKAEEADTAFRVSGQLGWRDVPTQLYWYRVGLLSNDPMLAAQRADAILRANPRYPGMEELLQPLESGASGRSELLARFAERPNWLANFAAPPPDTDRDELARRAQVLALLAGRGVILGCPAINSLTVQLVDNGLRQTALDLWSEHCNRNSAPSTLFDQTFAGLAPDRRSPFDWRTFGSGDVDIVDQTGADGKRQAIIANYSAFVQPVLAQTVELPPGRYRARLVVGDAGAARSRIFATLSCSKDPQRKGEVQGDLVGEGQTLVATVCQTQTFALWLRPGKDGITLRSITLDRAE